MTDRKRDFRYWRRGAEAADDVETAAVRSVLERSRDMFLQRSEGALSAVMHPDALVVGRLGGQVMTGGPAMIADILSGPAPADVERPWSLETMALGDGVASAAIRATEGGAVFLAHVVLVRLEEDWRIVALSYEVV